MVGASTGLSAVARHAAVWSAAFVRPASEQVLQFVRSLLSPPCGPPVARLFGAQMLGAVGRAVLEEPQGRGPLALPLLVDVCEALRPEVSVHIECTLAQRCTIHS